MSLNKKQALALRQGLMKQRRFIESIQEQPSRRYKNQVVHEEADARGYRAVLAYIEQGLGDEKETVRHVLEIVSKVQGQCQLKYPVYFYAFGGDDPDLRSAKQVREGRWSVNVEGWADELCGLAGNDNPARPVTIPQLFPATGSYRPKDWRDALPLIFCRDRNVQMTESAKKQLRLHVAQCAVWVFCGTDNVELEVGTFVPSAMPQTKVEETHSRAKETDDLEARLDRVLAEVERAEMCETCHRRPATHFRESTWGSPGGPREGMQLCDECSANTMF